MLAEELIRKLGDSCSSDNEVENSCIDTVGALFKEEEAAVLYYDKDETFLFNRARLLGQEYQVEEVEDRDEWLQSLTEKQREISERLIEQYEASDQNRDSEHLVRALSHLFKATEKEEILSTYLETAEQFLENGWGVVSLTEALTALCVEGVYSSELTVEKLSAFGLAHSFLQERVQDFMVSHRFDLIPYVVETINNEGSADLITTMCMCCSCMPAVDWGDTCKSIRGLALRKISAEDEEIVLAGCTREATSKGNIASFLSGYFSLISWIENGESVQGEYVTDIPTLLERYREGVKTFISYGVVGDLETYLGKLKNRIGNYKDDTHFQFLNHVYCFSERRGSNEPDIGVGQDLIRTFQYKGISKFRMKGFMKRVQAGEISTPEEAHLELAKLYADRSYAVSRSPVKCETDKDNLLRGIEFVIEQEQPTAGYIDLYMEVVNRHKKEEQIEELSLFRKRVSDLIDSNQNPYELVRWMVKFSDQELGLEIYTSFYDEFVSASKDEQRRCRDCLKSLNAAPSQMSRNVLEGVKNGRIGSFKEALKVMTDIAAHEQLKSLAREAESSEEGGGMGQNWTSAIARTLGSKHSRHWEQPDRVSRALVAFGHELPPLELNKRSKRVFQNSIRIGQYYSGFVSQQCDAETVADGTPSMLYQFGRDVGGVMGIYGGSPSEFPGRGGVLISSIDRSKIYGIGDDPDDPFKAFKEAWPTRAKAIDLLHKAEFVLTRGLISVTIPSTDDFKLTLSENESEHLTFVLYNDHHRNTGERAHLVSTNSFRGKVRDSLFDPEVGLDIGEVKDINDAKLTAKDLLALREDGYYKALDVGAAVNFVGGYSYSFPTDSPHFRWSNSEIIVGDNFTRDHFGYPNYESRQEVVMQIGGDIMQMRYLDDQIGEMVKLGLDLIDLLFIAQSDWKKGFTSGTLDFLPTEHSQPESELPQPDQYRDIVPTESPDNEFIHNQPSLRMLVQAYNYRKEWLQKDKDRERYRVLGLCNTLEPANQLGEDNLEGDRIWLDTWDMKLHVGSVVYELPLESDGTGPEESAIWLGTIIPQLTDTFKTVRFFDRISISDSIETE